MAATLSSWSVTSAAVGWAKMVRIAAATISAEALGTRASTLRRKCTRQRCQPAPARTAPLACLRPVWASETTSCTPAASTDLLGGVGVDQCLQHQPERFTDDVQATAGAQRCKQVGHGRLVKGHRGGLLGVNLVGNTLRFTRWPLACYSASQGPVLKVHHILGRLRPPPQAVYTAPGTPPAQHVGISSGQM